MKLITYLPFYRIHEIIEYFDKNVQAIKPTEAVVYVDNVFHPKQTEILKTIIPPYIKVRTGNWHNRNETWFSILKEMQGNEEVAVIDSDNLIDNLFLEANSQMKYSMYTVLDREAWARGAPGATIRSRKLGEITVNDKKLPVFGYRIYEPNLTKGGPVFFVGPKQIVVYKKMPEMEIINRVERAFSRVPSDFRQFISDEVTLGIIAHLSDLREMPWTIMSTHMHHSSEHSISDSRKTIIASAQLKFAKSLKKEFGLHVFTIYEVKYWLSLVRNLSHLF